MVSNKLLCNEKALCFRCSEGHMNVSYKKLFKFLIDKDMKKKDLREKAGLSNSTMTKLANNENVAMEVMAKICNAGL